VFSTRWSACSRCIRHFPKRLGYIQLIPFSCQLSWCFANNLWPFFPVAVVEQVYNQSIGELNIHKCYALQGNMTFILTNKQFANKFEQHHSKSAQHSSKIRPQGKTETYLVTLDVSGERRKRRRRWERIRSPVSSRCGRR